jgi:2,3-bisphosphoglycerate-independent phosphoglycerate mutase
MNPNRKVAWLMLDGVGIANFHDQHPFQNQDIPTLTRLGISSVQHVTEAEFISHPIDATLGVEGLPQSGTGQTTLLTGINAAKVMGRHYGPWPGPSLKPLLEQSLPIQLSRAGLTVRLTNHYPQRYLEAIATGKRKLNAIAFAMTLAGAKLEFGIPPMLTNPEDPNSTSLEQVKVWGQEFMGSNANLTVFDAWWSDHLGHHGTLLEAQDHVTRLEAFVTSALEAQGSNTLFLVTSDHGNFEDIGIKTHTFAPVPLVAIGQGALEFAVVKDLTGVAPALKAWFERQSSRLDSTPSVRSKTEPEK